MMRLKAEETFQATSIVVPANLPMKTQLNLVLHDRSLIKYAKYPYYDTAL